MLDLILFDGGSKLRFRVDELFLELAGDRLFVDSRCDLDRFGRSGRLKDDKDKSSIGIVRFSDRPDMYDDVLVTVIGLDAQCRNRNGGRALHRSIKRRTKFEAKLWPGDIQKVL